MIGLVLVTHGRLADEFVTAMAHVVGPQEQIAAIAIGPEDDMEGRRGDIAEAVAWVLGLPRHVNINRIEMMPTCQASAPFAIKREG